MSIFIEKEKYSYLFCLWLLKRLKLEIFNKVGKHNFQHFKEYFKKELKITDDFFVVVRICLDHVKINISKNNYKIYISENDYYKNTNVRISTIVNLIDFGNLSIRGCYLFSEIFNNISDNIKNYYRIYNPYY